MKTFGICVAVLLSLTTAVHAETVDQLKAQIRANLSTSPQIKNMTPAEYEALVQALVTKAQTVGLHSSNIAPVATPVEAEATPESVSACEGLKLVCVLAFKLNLSFMHAWWLILGFLAGILFLMWEVVHNMHAKQMVQPGMQK